jgi:hypothetical protein
MRRSLAWFLSMVVLSGVALYATAAVIASPWQDGWSVGEAAEGTLWEPPGEPQGRPEPPPPPSPEDRAAEVRAREQRPPGGPPPATPPYGRGRPLEARRVPPLLGMAERLLPLIAERHPELAEKLRQLRERSPEEFRRVLADAVALRLEEALERSEHRRFGPDQPSAGPRPPEPPGRPRWGEHEREMPEEHMALERETQELHRRNEGLEHRSHELAERFRELRQRRDPELEPERDEVRHQIERAVEEHFDVRTELRRIELRRVEMELDRLREVVERIRHDLDRREQGRGPIIEQRLRQLLGKEGEDW